MKKQKSLQDILIVLFLIALSGYVFITSGGFRGESGMFPRIVAAVTLVLCFLQLGAGVREYLSSPADEPQAPAAKAFNGFWAVAATLLGYTALIFVAGYYIATAVYLCMSMFLFGFRKKVALICIAAGMLIFVYILFSVLLRVQLPGGLLF